MAGALLVESTLRLVGRYHGAVAPRDCRESDVVEYEPNRYGFAAHDAKAGDPLILITAGVVTVRKAAKWRER